MPRKIKTIVVENEPRFGALYEIESPDVLISDAWAKAKKKAAQRVRDTAAELLDLYSRRAARTGQQLTANEADLRAFEAAFPFEETPDQATAIRPLVQAGGQVVLSGSVASYEAKLEASECLRRVNGCTCVINLLEVLQVELDGRTHTRVSADGLPLSAPQVVIRPRPSLTSNQMTE